MKKKQGRGLAPTYKFMKYIHPTYKFIIKYIHLTFDIVNR